MDFDQLWNLDLSEIWKLTNQNSFVTAMYGWVCRKSGYGENLDTLTAEEQTFFICYILESEVNNGGFSQYLYNSSGDNAHRVVSSLISIGAEKTAEICRTALAAFGRPIPQGREEREEFLDVHESDEADEILNQCDTRFYQYEDNLEALYYSYIFAHKDCFC